MRRRIKTQFIIISLTLAGLAQSQLSFLKVSEAMAGGLFQSANTQTDSAKRSEKSITGRVVNESGQPIANAAVRLQKVGTGGVTVRSSITDLDGRFSVDDLASGAYSVFATTPGYVYATESLDRHYYHPGETFSVQMTRGGVISGTVTNSEGEAVIGARVSAVRVRDGEGRPIREAGSMVTRQTDDRGMYRVYGLQSGSYVIRVGGGGPNYYSSAAFETDAPTYHPSTTRDAAVEVTVRTGDEVTGIDVRYRGDTGHIVSGVLTGQVVSNTGSRGASLMLIRVPGNTIEDSAYVGMQGGEGVFALYGVPDGEYALIARSQAGMDASATFASRRVTVKGTDATGIVMTLAPLGDISGSVVLEPISKSDRKGECKDKHGLSIDEIVIAARRDDAVSGEQIALGFYPNPDVVPDSKGEFKIPNLLAARYRIDTVLPTENWYVRSIAAISAAKQQSDISSAGLSLGSGQRVAGITVTITEGASALRGKVVAGSDSANPPSHLRVHLVPAEEDSWDSILRYGESPVDDGGNFSITNLSPGRYFVLARAMTDEEIMQREFRPLACDAASRTKLRRDAQAANVMVELQRCQHVGDYSLKYSPPPVRKSSAPKTKPQLRL